MLISVKCGLLIRAITMHTHTKDDWPVPYTLCSLLCNDTLSKLLQTLYNDNVSWNAFFYHHSFRTAVVDFVLIIFLAWEWCDVSLRYTPYPFFVKKKLLFYFVGINRRSQKYMVMLKMLWMLMMNRHSGECIECLTIILIPCITTWKTWMN